MLLPLALLLPLVPLPALLLVPPLVLLPAPLLVPLLLPQLLQSNHFGDQESRLRAAFFSSASPTVLIVRLVQTLSQPVPSSALATTMSSSAHDSVAAMIVRTRAG